MDGSKCEQKNNTDTPIQIYVRAAVTIEIFLFSLISVNYVYL